MREKAFPSNYHTIFVNVWFRIWQVAKLVIQNFTLSEILIPDLTRCKNFSSKSNMVVTVLKPNLIGCGFSVLISATLRAIGFKIWHDVKFWFGNWHFVNFWLQIWNVVNFSVRNLRLCKCFKLTSNTLKKLTHFSNIAVNLCLQNLTPCKYLDCKSDTF